MNANCDDDDKFNGTLILIVSISRRISCRLGNVIFFSFSHSLGCSVSMSDQLVAAASEHRRAIKVVHVVSEQMRRASCRLLQEDDDEWRKFLSIETCCLLASVKEKSI